MIKYNIKTNRIFTKWRKWAWVGTFIIAVGGLFEPLLGLLVLLVMAGLMITSFLRGRWWCGNICTHGSFYDLILVKFSKNEKIPKILRSNGIVIFFLAFFMYNMGRGMVNAFTSETIFRTKTLFLFPSQVDVTATIGFLRAVGFVFVNTYWMVIVISIALGLLINSRTWCQFCPMGTFQRIFYALGKFLGVCKKTDVKISAKSKSICHSCAKCNRVCPMQLYPYLEFDKNHQFGSDKCIKCKTCIMNCPAGILSLHSEFDAINTNKKFEEAYLLNKSEHSAIIHEMKFLASDVLEIIFKIQTDGFEFYPRSIHLGQDKGKSEDKQGLFHLKI